MSAPVSSSLSDTITAVRNGLFSAVECRDVEKIVSYYSDDCINQMTGAPPMIGKEAARKVYEAIFAVLPAPENTKDPMAGINRTSTALLCDAAAGQDPHMVVDCNAVTGVMPAPTGGSLEIDQVMTIIWIKVNNEWKIKVFDNIVVGEKTTGKYPDFIRSAVSEASKQQ